MNLSAVLLAGGESRRMGRDKATIAFRGRPLWRHQIDLLQEIAPAEILISASTNPAWRPKETIFVADRRPLCGPLGGVTAALGAMRGTHLLIIAVDMPLMTVRYLKWMCGLIAQDRPGVLPKIAGRAEPLAAIYPRESLTHFVKALEGHDFSMQGVADTLVRFNLLSVIDVPEIHEKLFLNINAPSDIQTLDHGADSNPELAGEPISN